MYSIYDYGDEVKAFKFTLYTHGMAKISGLGSRVNEKMHWRHKKAMQTRKKYPAKQNFSKKNPAIIKILLQA